jgi:histidinol-phosphate aminotransferase
MMMSNVDRVRRAVRDLSAYSVPHPPSVRVKLDANEFPFDLPVEIRNELGQALASVDVNRYPPADAGELRELLCAEQDVRPDEIVLGNGSDELIHLLCQTFAEPREGKNQAAVLYPTPTFSVFRTATAASGCRAVEVPLLDDFSVDAKRMSEAIAREQPNLVFIARPNNPTGSEWPLASFLDCVRAFPEVLFISDEAYADYGGSSALSAWRQLPNLLIMRTLSKIGLAGLRIGTVSGPSELCREVEKVRSAYNIGILHLTAAALLLSKHRDWFKRSCQTVVSERPRVQAALEKKGFRVFESVANFLLFRVPDAERLYQELVGKGILVRNLDQPGPLANCLRVTIGTPEDNAAFIAAL